MKSNMRVFPGLRASLPAAAGLAARRITEENYLSGIQTTYQGRCMAVLCAGYEPGTAQLQIRTEQYGEKRLVISLRLDEKEDNA